MSVATYDQLRTLYRTLLLFAFAGVLILFLGLAEFVYFEPPGQTSAAQAHIVGVYAYDPATRQTIDGDRSEFRRSEQFAAVIDWSSIPSGFVVDARWYDAFGSIVGRAGPAKPADLASHRIVPVEVPAGLHHVLPGHYILVVERFRGDIPVQVLGRRIILVDRT